ASFPALQRDAPTEKGRRAPFPPSPLGGGGSGVGGRSPRRPSPSPPAPLPRGARGAGADRGRRRGVQPFAAAAFGENERPATTRPATRLPGSTAAPTLAGKRWARAPCLPLTHPLAGGTPCRV